MTVREAFEKAYGPVPEGATCHVADLFPYEGSEIRPVFALEGKVYHASYGVWEACFAGAEEVGPDIGDRPASAFVGFFSGAYDDVVSEDQAAWRAALHGSRVSVSDAEDDGA